MLTSRNKSEEHAYFVPGDMEQSWRNKKIVNMHRCKQCKHWCKVTHAAGKIVFTLKEVSSCCGAEVSFERYEQNPNN